MSSDPAIVELNSQLTELNKALRLVAESSAQASNEQKRFSQESERASQTFLGSARQHFDSARQTYDSISNFVGQIEAGATRVAAFADEQHRLDELSARLSLDFDAAAASAGRFADETEAAQAAAEFLQRDVRLTQEQLNALERVAGATSHVLGTTTVEATQRLTQALITGRDRALAPFGSGLSALAGPTHTVQERLAELVAQASRVAPATDTAGDSILRFRDNVEDSQRVIATAFTESLRRISQTATATSQASQSTEDWNANLRAIGDTAGFVVSLVGNAVAAVAGSIAVTVQLAITGFRQMYAAADAAAHLRNPLTAARSVDTSGLTSTLEFNANRLQAMRDTWRDAYSDRTTARPEPGARRQDPGGVGSMAFSSDETGVADMEFSREQTGLFGRGRGGSGGGRHEDRTAAIMARARADAQTYAAAHADTTRRQQAAMDARVSGGESRVGRLFAQLRDAAETANLDFALGRGRDGVLRDPTLGERDPAERVRAASEHVRVLREQRAALAALLPEAERYEAVVRASGAPEAEVREAMQQRIGVMNALVDANQRVAESTVQLAEAQRESSQWMRDISDEMGSHLSGLGEGIAATAIAAAEAGEGLDKALHAAFRSFVKDLAQRSIFEALKNTALGIAGLASGNPAAIGHFKAAGIWAAIGVASGGALAAIPKVGDDSTAKASGGARSPSSTDRASRVDRGARGESGPLVLNISVSGALFNDGVHEGVGRAVRGALGAGYLTPEHLRGLAT